MTVSKAQVDHIPQSFGMWSAISLGWLTLNVFGGMSFIMFVGFSAGGVPTILYGFIGSCAAVLCIILTFMQCASVYSTAGGAYHYACFLLSGKHSRPIAYTLGWMNYLGWIFTHAGCCAIVATLILALINLCQPEFDVVTRWQLFLVYLAVGVLCWLINLLGLKGIPKLELMGCYATALGFVAFTFTLLIIAPKAEPRVVFVETVNKTGYQSTALARLLGLMSSFATLMGLDGPSHVAEEIPQPKKILPRILLIVILSQTVVGVIWIIVLGFSITDMDAIVNTKTGVPVLELIRLATGSDSAAIVFCILLIINNSTSALGSAVSMSRQGYAFARDGGLLWNTNYLFSYTAFNAIIGSQAVCMIISFGAPALIMLTRGNEALPRKGRWQWGIFTVPIYLISVGYSVLVVIVAMIPTVSPVTPQNMNYTLLVIGGFFLVMMIAWRYEGHSAFTLPVNREEAATTYVIESVEANIESGQTDGLSKDTLRYVSTESAKRE